MFSRKLCKCLSLKMSSILVQFEVSGIVQVRSWFAWTSFSSLGNISPALFCFLDEIEVIVSVSRELVLEAISLLNNNKISGKDGQVAKFHKAMNDRLVLELIQMFNYSLREGCLEASHKKRLYWFLLFREGNNFDIKKQAPIPLLSNNDKMFVKIMLATGKMKGPKSPSFLFHIINLVVSKPAGNVT